ncbi:MAG: hypothetical protein PHN60_02675 [Candidatus Gracilibacteria bacterium]|nr:hypothetical protein [Candidatus Gracilibacteria bacterium]
MTAFKKALYSALVFFGTLIVLSVGYAAYSTMTPATSGQPLTIGIWNAMITNMDDLNTRVDSLVSGGGNLWNTGATSSINYTAGKVKVGSVSGNAELDIQSGTKPHWGIYHDETSEELRFWNGSNRVVFGSGGNVGIGMSNPSWALDIGANTNGRSGLGINATTENAYISLNRTGDAVTLVNKNDGTFRINHSGSSGDAHLVIGTGGYIGVGTASPTAKLDIRGQSETEFHYVAGLVDPYSGNRKILMRHTITDTNSYYKLALPQTYSNSENNGGVVTLNVMWLGRHAIGSCNQEYKLVYGTYHTAVPAYLAISQISRMFSQCSPNSYSYWYDQTPDVDFWVDSTGGFLIFNIKGMHVQSTNRLIDIEILGQTLSTPVLSYYGTSLPAGASLLTETVLH